MAELIMRLRGGAAPGPGARRGDLWWVLVVGSPIALLLGWLLTLSLQAACAFSLVVLVVALHEHDRRWGITAVFGLWLLAPGLRRLLGLETGYIENDPLSLAPFLATGAVAVIELSRTHVPTQIRQILLAIAAGFAVGLPVGFAAGPRAAVFAFIAYLTGLAGAALGLGESTSTRESTLRRVLLFGIPFIAAYAILQRLLPLPSWDQAWIDATAFSSIGTGEGEVRVFGTLNSPGSLAALLGLSLLSFISLQQGRFVAVVGAGLVTVALALTFARSAWVALIVAALAHVIASNGRSARLVLGTGAVVAAATIALAPVNSTASEVLERFRSITDVQRDTSSTERRATFSETLPVALAAPLGHGLGSAGEPSKLSGDSFLRATDNGYLSLIYQVGPIGFLLVMGGLFFVLRAAWNGARARAPGQELRLLFFAMLVFLAVQAAFGDTFYGVSGLILWFIGGQALAYDFRRRRAAAAA